ncbi:MAG: CPBP family intramembrane metalloprotease [Anaerolineales bacterium]|nr:CPBP family intramembrane metalloprotease [Anaerolineales bacterium]
MVKNKSEKSFVRNVASIFWNFNEGRLRAIWRVLVTLLGTVILTFIFGAPFFMISGAGPGPYIEKILLYAAILVSVWLATRFLDRRRFSDTGIYMKRNWWIDLGFGLLLGALLMTFIFLVELAAGWITIRETFYAANSSQPFLVTFLLPVLLALIVGIAEELMFRGYLLLNLAEGFNLRMIGPRWALMLAWLLTSALFGFAHMINPNATVLSSVNIALIGMWLGLGYVLTGSLAIPIGIHITWNLFQGYVFGFPVSGGEEFSSAFVVIEQGGPELWTGGAFGPEAGLIGLFAFVIGVLLAVAWVRIRYHRLTLYTAIAEPPSER